MPLLDNILPEDDEDNSLLNLVGSGGAWAQIQEISTLQDEEEEIDLQALADEVYTLLKKELRLELQRRGRR